MAMMGGPQESVSEHLGAPGELAGPSERLQTATRGIPRSARGRARARSRGLNLDSEKYIENR